MEGVRLGMMRNRRWPAAAMGLTLAAYLILAGLFWSVTGEDAQRTWASLATTSYAASLVLWCWPMTRRIAPWVALAGSVVVPTVWLVVTGAGQPEVQVVRDGADAMLNHATPYEVSPTELYDYRPYLPALFAFGLLPGPAGDIRLTGAVVLLAAIGGAIVAMRQEPAPAGQMGPGPGQGRTGVGTTVAAGVGAGRGRRLTWWLAKAASPPHAMLLACPVVALAIAGSGIDAPQAALTIAAVTLMRSHPNASAVAVGLSLAMKPTALCVLFIVMLASRARSGNRAMLTYGAIAAATAAVLVVPVLAVSPNGLFENVVSFPAGRSGLASPAESPFPGVLLRQGGAAPWLQSSLVVLTAAAYAVWCWRHVTSEPVNVAGHIAAGLALAFMVVPYSRAGYLMLPAIVWLTFRLAAPARDATKPAGAAAPPAERDQLY